MSTALTRLTNRPAPSSLVERFELLCVTTDSANLQEWTEFQALRAAAIDAILALPPQSPSDPEVEAARRIVEAYVGSDLVEVASTRDLAKANACLNSGWTGVLAALLLAPAWQLGHTLRLELLPSGFSPQFFFRQPARLTSPEQGDAGLTHYLERLRDLVRLAETEPGSSEARRALAGRGHLAEATLSCRSPHLLNELLSWYARWVSALLGGHRQLATTSRICSGRRLRLGFVLERVEHVALLRAALPWLGQPDARHFEVSLFTLRPSHSDLASQAAARAGEPHLVGIGPPFAVHHLRESLLDAVVYYTRATHHGDLVTTIAAHRVAPLQIALDGTRLASAPARTAASRAPVTCAEPCSV